MGNFALFLAVWSAHGKSFLLEYHCANYYLIGIIGIFTTLNLIGRIQKCLVFFYTTVMKKRFWIL